MDTLGTELIGHISDDDLAELIGPELTAALSQPSDLTSHAIGKVATDMRPPESPYNDGRLYSMGSSGGAGSGPSGGAGSKPGSGGGGSGQGGGSAGGSGSGGSSGGGSGGTGGGK